MTDSVTNKIVRAQRTIDNSRKTLSTFTYAAATNSTSSSVQVTSTTSPATLDGSGSSIATDGSKGNVFSVTLDGGTTMTLANPTNISHGVEYTWNLVQGVSTGDITIFGTWFVFPGGTLPALSSTTGQIDVLRGTAVKIGANPFVIYASAEINVA